MGEKVKGLIICFREFLLKHFKNKKIRTLIYGLISYEMISYVFFGIGTSIVDFIIYTLLNQIGMQALIVNLISTLCAVVFAYVTNKLWVFKSKTHGVKEVFEEFCRFTYARLATLLMTEIIIVISQIIYGNDKQANLIAKLLGMLLTIILNYILSKLFIFNDKRKGNKNGH